MSSLELERLGLMQRIAERRTTQRVVAEQLGVSLRQVERMYAAYKAHGAKGLHVARGATRHAEPHAPLQTRNVPARAERPLPRGGRQDRSRSRDAPLRVVALGRTNFMFVGDREASENLAVLYSIVATCEAHGVNPYTYLADVLVRVQSHPAARLDELLPERWAALVSN